MEGYPSFKGLKLDNRVKDLIKSNFKIISYCEGQTKANFTNEGGVFYTGTPTITKSIMFELQSVSYIVIQLYEYPKGLVFHAFIDLRGFNKGQEFWDKTTRKIYDKLSELFYS